MKKIFFAALAASISFGGWVLSFGGPPSTHPIEDGLPSGIAWYGVIDDGIAEAKATGRPILLVSAAPQCAGVPGMW